MSYQINFTEANNPSKLPLIVQDQTLNSQTSVTFVGKNYPGYSPIIAENFLHLLENFASPNAPENPVQGQLWYDSSVGINLLKVFDGTNWTEAGAVKKSDSAPAVANSIRGDLWIDTTNQQLYLFSGSAWLLVGPQFSVGSNTGPIVETLVDKDNINHPVVSIYSNNVRVAIVSEETFIPKSSLQGFSNGIIKGINLTTGDSSGLNALALTSYKLYGTASSADALNVNNKVVSAANFLRSDVISKTLNALQIQSDSGLSLGSDLGFSISTNSDSVDLYSQSTSKAINIKMRNSDGGVSSVLHINSNKNIGIGENNFNPEATLDVLGDIRGQGRIYTSSTEDANNLNEGSLTTLGGMSVALNSYFGEDVTVYGKIIPVNVDGDNNPITGTVIVPGPLSSADGDVANKYDIGSLTRPFRNVYAQAFVGSFSGTFSGTTTANTSGSAAYLASSTNLKITGDVESTNSTGVPFNGVTQTGTLDLPVTLASSAITGQQVELTSSKSTDQLLVYRSDSNYTGLAKTTQATFLGGISQVPTGTILPYAGATAPTGYLLCDGSEVSRTTYSVLFGIIGYRYRAESQLQGFASFALPDLRGRFALGADNMVNSSLPDLPSKVNQAVLISATPDSAAGRVTETSASNVGSGGGASKKSLVLSNIPQHTHSFNSGNAQYYAPGAPGALPDGLAVAGKGTESLTTGQGLANSGKISGGSDPVTAVDIQNPYLTINYIIKT